MDGCWKPAPATLAALPNEILCDIVSNFCLHCSDLHETPLALLPRADTDPADSWMSWYTVDRQALYSICLVSRRFRAVAQPVLYHEFLPGYGQTTAWNRRLDSFLRTVVLRPDLGSLVRRVFLNPNLGGGMYGREPQTVLEDAARARNIPLADFLKPYQDRSFSKDARLPSFDEVAAMLLACLPNLASLVYPDVLFEPVPVAAMTAAGVSTLPLRAVEVLGMWASRADNLASILDLAAPTLKVLRINGSATGVLESLAPHLCDLRDIYVIECKFGGADLASLLSRCQSLERFVYEAVPGGERFLPLDAAEHLLKNKATLKTLHLDIKGRYYDPPATNDGFRSSLLPNLSSFPVLQHLLLNTLTLYPQGKSYRGLNSPMSQITTPLHDILPPSIVSLRLVDNAWSSGVLALLAEDLMLLARAVTTGAFPSLKRILIDTEWRVENEYEVADLLATRGVEFEYFSWPVSRGKARQLPSTPPILEDDDMGEGFSDVGVEEAEWRIRSSPEYDDMSEDGAGIEGGGRTVDSSSEAADSDEEMY